MTRSALEAKHIRQTLAEARRILEKNFAMLTSASAHKLIARLIQTPPITHTHPRSMQHVSPRQYGTSETITITDSRKLGFAAYGPANGIPLIWFHGLPGSRLDVADREPMLQKLNVRVFGVDRPGYGLSTYQANRKLLDWPGDVRQLARHLGLKQFHVMGGSGGGPYALACAKVLPKDMLLGAGIIAGAGPPESGAEGMSMLGKMYYSVSAWPSVIAITRKVLDWYVVPNAQHADPQVWRNECAKVIAKLSEKDRATFDDKLALDTMIETLRESFRQGSGRFAEDTRILGSTWSFKLEDVDCNMIKLYYGTQDINTPVSQARYMAKHVGNAILKEFPGETHFSIVKYDEEILRNFMGDAGSGDGQFSYYHALEGTLDLPVSIKIWWKGLMHCERARCRVTTGLLCQNLMLHFISTSTRSHHCRL